LSFWNVVELGFNTVRSATPGFIEEHSTALPERAVVERWLTMQIAHYRRVERRRSARVTLAVPLRVDGRAITGEDFIMRTQTHTVSEFGCLLPLDAEVAPDQTVVLQNEYTRQSVQCKVVTTRRNREGKRFLGVEFLSPNCNFWRMAFSKPGARSLKRQYGSNRDSSSHSW
jgi:hypothetical protein